MHRGPVLIGLVAAATAAGCAHFREPYAYQPPLAPPVYPQPQLAPPMVTYGAPGPAPLVAPGPAAAAVPGAAQGVVMATAEGCPSGCDGAAVPVVYQEGQTPPCPPGP